MRLVHGGAEEVGRKGCEIRRGRDVESGEWVRVGVLTCRHGGLVESTRRERGLSSREVGEAVRQQDRSSGHLG